MAIERTTSKAKIEVISRVWSSCVEGSQSCRKLDPRKRTQQVPPHELVSWLYPRQEHKQQNHNQPREMLKQHDANMICYAGCDVMHMQDLTRNE